MGAVRALLCCLTAVAISACAVVDDEAPPAMVARARSVSLPEPPDPVVEPRVAAPAAPSLPRTHQAVAADLAGSGEPLIAVAGYLDEEEVASIPLYAQRNGGWRRISAAEWPGGEGWTTRAVDAGDLDGDGVPELAVLGRAKKSDRAALAVFRLRDRELEPVTDVSWQGPGDDLSLADVDGNGRHEVVVWRRDHRPARSFRLERDRLVEHAAKGAHRRSAEKMVMTLPGSGAAMRAVVRAASGGPSMLGTVQDWNAELARLRPR